MPSVASRNRLQVGKAPTTRVASASNLSKGRGITPKKAISRAKNSVNFGTYKEKDIVSVGGSIGRPGKNIGGTIGLDKGKPFGSVNVKGKVIAKFGKQEESPKKKPAKRK